jgi:hypothetical protein
MLSEVFLILTIRSITNYYNFYYILESKLLVSKKRLEEVVIMDKSNNCYDAYEKAFKKFEEKNGYSFFELAIDSDLQKSHYEKNKKILNGDTKDVQLIYDILSTDKVIFSK